MAQLVGQSCGICSGSISSITDGRFCDECGCAIHSQCSHDASHAPSDENCPSCGAIGRQSDRHARGKHKKTSGFNNTVRGPIWVVCGIGMVGFGIVRLVVVLVALVGERFVNPFRLVEAVIMTAAGALVLTFASRIRAARNDESQ
jgi:hypothetical protein